MKRAMKTMVPVLALGLVMQSPTRAVTPSAAFNKGVKVAEAALTLNEVAKLLFDVGSLSGDRARIQVAVHLAAWASRHEGGYQGNRFMESSRYRYFPATQEALYVRTRLEGRKVVTSFEPFPINTLENRQYLCVPKKGDTSTWEARQASFAMAAHATVLERVGSFPDGFGPWTCVVMAQRTPLASDCTPSADADTYARQLVTVAEAGRTYFTFDRGGNYLYGMPEIFIGGQAAGGPAVVVPNPGRSPDTGPNGSQGADRVPVQNPNLNPDNQ